jgi:hypothetical protein
VGDWIRLSATCTYWQVSASSVLDSLLVLSRTVLSSPRDVRGRLLSSVKGRGNRRDVTGTSYLQLSSRFGCVRFLGIRCKPSPRLTMHLFRGGGGVERSDPTKLV